MHMSIYPLPISNKEGWIRSGPADYMPPSRGYLLFTVAIDMGTVRVIIKFLTDTHTVRCMEKVTLPEN